GACSPARSRPLSTPATYWINVWVPSTRHSASTPNCSKAGSISGSRGPTVAAVYDRRQSQIVRSPAVIDRRYSSNNFGSCTTLPESILGYALIPLNLALSLLFFGNRCANLIPAKMRRKIWSVKYVATVLLTSTVLILGGLNAQQKRRYIPPDDGAAWVEGTEGIQARLVVPDAPAEKAGIRRGDVLRAIHFTGKLNPFDWTIFWADLCASLLLPPLFLHFCLEFPSRNKTIERWHSLLYLIYLPAAVIFIAQLAFINGILGFQPSPILLRDVLDTLGDFHLALYFVLSAAVLLKTYRTVKTPELRQQMKWVTRGTALGVVPYFVLQSVPRLSGTIAQNYVDFSIFPLVLIPISFGYAIHRYRLMDVDIIFKRGVTYTLATA